MAKMNSTENFDLKKGIICHISEWTFSEKNVPSGGARFLKPVISRPKEEVFLSAYLKCLAFL